ncbi:MAG: hypothetical protein Q8K58_01720 [Acidimicrobiales bacterium]|nr:hypothetical protein [Acidimicrobiales bacterium]
MNINRELVMHRVWEASDCVPGVVDVLRELSEDTWARYGLYDLARRLGPQLRAHGSDEDDFVVVLERWVSAAS